MQRSEVSFRKDIHGSRRTEGSSRTYNPVREAHNRIDSAYRNVKESTDVSNKDRLKKARDLMKQCAEINAHLTPYIHLIGELRSRRLSGQELMNTLQDEQGPCNAARQHQEMGLGQNEAYNQTAQQIYNRLSRTLQGSFRQSTQFDMLHRLPQGEWPNYPI